MTMAVDLEKQAKRQRRYTAGLKKRGVLRRTIMVPALCEDEWKKARDRLLRKWKKDGML